MTYKLNSDLILIKSPIILVIDGEERSYPSGESLVKLEFNKRYVVESIRARDSYVVVTLEENNTINAVNWIGEEAVSFF